MASGSSTSGLFTVKVIDQRDNSAYFVRMRPTTPFVKLKNFFCEKTEKPKDYFAFLYDSKILRDNDTPERVGMELAEEEVTAFRHCLGAGPQNIRMKKTHN